MDNKGNIYVTGCSYIGSNYDYFTVKYDSSGNIVWADTIDNNGNNDYAYSIAVDSQYNIYITGSSNIGLNGDYLTVKYTPYKDAGILSIASPDTVCSDSNYIPAIYIANNSPVPLNFDVAAYIDSEGTVIYSDTQSVSDLAEGDSTLINFSQWPAPSNAVALNLRFSIITSDMNSDNDTLSGNLYVRDHTLPVLDSAIAYDGTDPVSGIDDDDYVILYFSEPTNKPTIDNSNINSALPLSSGHSWLDGSGNIGTCVWNTDGDQLQINFTTTTSLPTTAVGDTITPDGETITDVNGNPCSSPTILGGTFEPAGILDKKYITRMTLNTPTINRNSIYLAYTIAKPGIYTITIHSLDGRVIKKIQEEGKGSFNIHINNIPAGIYFVNLKQRDNIINKKVVVIK